MRLAWKRFDPARSLDNRGVAAIEYALIASLIALSIIVGIANLGGAVGNQFNHVDAGVGSAGTKFEH
jgi:Flp pilus assembly pilin Flp